MAKKEEISNLNAEEFNEETSEFDESLFEGLDSTSE